MSQIWLKNQKSTYLVDQHPLFKIKCFIANAEDSAWKTYKLFQKPLLGPQLLLLFYGDGPGQQFEAGHKIGGKYSCIGYGALTSRFDDFA